MSWRDLAECRGLAWWCQDPPQGRHGAEADAFWARRKSVCAVCPVSAECLEDARSGREMEWVWGGLTPGERCNGPFVETRRECKRCGVEFVLRPKGPTRLYCTRTCRDRAATEKRVWSKPKVAS